jgi:pyrroline-5-carboxylate reductase
MSADTGAVALIGAGRMGAAIAAGWLADADRPSASDILVIDPEPGEAAQALIEAHGLAWRRSLDPESAARVRALVLAVKPRAMGPLCRELAEAVRHDALVVSIAAGVTLRSLESWLPGRPVVRAMPNTPAAIGKGATVMVSNAVVDDAGLRSAAEALLRPTGLVEWIEEERLMGAVTAVSGSGPAYVFLLAEALAAAGAAEGLPRDLARRLAEQTVTGAGALLDAEGDAEALRRAVTSPGGTTQAALDVLMQGLPSLMRNAVAAAERRSRQLGGDAD